MAPESMAPESMAPESSAPAVDYSGLQGLRRVRHRRPWRQGLQRPRPQGPRGRQGAWLPDRLQRGQGATDYAANIQRLIDEGCNSIITVGFNQAQATVEATKANTDIAFGQVDAVWDEAANGATPANFSGLDFQIDEAATLAGYVAAGVSKSGVIGTYGGQQFPGVTRFMDGYYAGIALYNKAHGTTAKLLGWDAAKQTGTFVGGDNPWGDPAKGEQLAKTFIDQGADIVASGRGRHRQRLDQGDARGQRATPSASTPTSRSASPSTLPRC